LHQCNQPPQHCNFSGDIPNLLYIGKTSFSETLMARHKKTENKKRELSRLPRALGLITQTEQALRKESQPSIRQSMA
jgi:hypothetical protein